MIRREGYALEEIQDWLGHESSDTTKALYVHTDVYDLLKKMHEVEAGKAER